MLPIFPPLYGNEVSKIGLTQVALLYHRKPLACALRKPLFFESLPANGTSYRQNCVSPVKKKTIVDLI